MVRYTFEGDGNEPGKRMAPVPARWKSKIFPRRCGASYPALLTNANGTLYFAAQDNHGHLELWKSDGTVAGTVQVPSEIPSSSPSYLENVNGTLYFYTSDGTAPTQLWQSDGTATGTVALGPGQSLPINVNGSLYYIVTQSGGDISLTSLIGPRTDIGGNQLILSNNPTGNEFQNFTNFSPSNLTNINGVLYFSSPFPYDQNDNFEGNAIWNRPYKW